MSDEALMLDACIRPKEWKKIDYAMHREEQRYRQMMRPGLTGARHAKACRRFARSERMENHAIDDAIAKRPRA